LRINPTPGRKQQDSLSFRKVVIQVSIRLRQTGFNIRTWIIAVLMVGLFCFQHPATLQAQTGKPYDEKPLTDAEIAAKQESTRLAKVDQELRGRFENSLWNDVEITIGQPGYQWWLRTRKNKGPEQTWKREWYLNERGQLSQVGTWDVQQGELLMIAPDGRVVAQGKLDKHEEVKGQFYDPDQKHAYGSFHLIEQSNRMYSIVPFRVIDRNAGK